MARQNGETFGERLARLRTLRGWSRKELARRSKVSDTQIGVLETKSSTNPQARTVDALARGLVVPVGMLRHGPVPDDFDRYPLDVEPAAAFLAPSGTNGFRSPPAVYQPPSVAGLSAEFMAVYILKVTRQEFVAASGDDAALGEQVGTSQYVAVPANVGAGRLLKAVRVEGSCMEPEINAGDVVIVELGRYPTDGDVVVVSYQAKTLIKRWWREGDYVDLEANRAGDSLRVHADQLTVHGVVLKGMYDVRRITRRQRHRPE
jgi:transcriptional regulator with XRE-family HTH domain